jgi:ribonuclease Z
VCPPVIDASLLGTGGWMPTAQRATACVLLRSAQDALVIDAGTGIQRLVTEPDYLHNVRRIAVVLTHFHLDHVCGLLYLPALERRMTVWAPGMWLYGRPSERVLAHLLRPPISPSERHELPEVAELVSGRQRIGTFDIVARAQPRHWAPSAGLRVGNYVAVVTDTGYDPGSVDLAAGVDTLLHEAWSSSREPIAADMDSTGADAGRVAAAAGAKRLILIHLNPRVDQDRVLEDARDVFREARLGVDGEMLSLGGSGRSIEIASRGDRG